jgi:predicted dithiol-disulfide oxidoreductase (DUF899 family)
MAMPPIVSAQEWQQARDELLVAEKEATRHVDAVAARRRRLPMVEMGAYTFAGPSGPVSLTDLFGGRDELVVYQFMDVGPASARAARTSATTSRTLTVCVVGGSPS